MFYKAPPLSLFLGKVFGEQRLLVSYFVWTAAWNKTLNGDNMKNKGFDFVDWCCMCQYCGENVDHLLIHCEKAQQL